FKRVVQRIINLDDDLLLVTAQQSDTQPSEITIPKIESTPRPTENLVALSTVALVAQPVKNTNNCTIPDIRGMSLRKALKTIRIAGLIPKFQGSGTVAWQSPKPGLIVSPNSTCVIGLK
ncbi:MAG: PASTA domain-containing protein, partial [Candidatus Marinimicrobia bacterium]|nr:PASTA domain-containing protein [Candidatus Neomarinimicrobiota bacterium]